MAAPNTDKLYLQLNAAELEAIIKKDSPSSNDRDAGFCSASSESEGGDDLTVESARCGSPNSEQIEECITLEEKSIMMVRHKRKSMEPSKVVESMELPVNYSPFTEAGSNMEVTGPPKKRIRYTSSADSAVILTPPSLSSPPHTSNNHFPSNLENAWYSSQVLMFAKIPNPAHIFVRHPGVTTLHRSLALTTQPEQNEPLALVTRVHTERLHTSQQNPIINSVYERSKKEASNVSLDLNDNEVSKECSSLSRPQQRNYKNMTRERRIEANARERTRVHTISAAYETLRRAVPAYASSQKLSKLSVLRVACSYILTLSRMAGQDYSSDMSEPTVADCMEAITSTIQTEGKTKRKKED
ncbi:hypothetical protein KR222_008143 [Zaprionus bogoriensis]|nr:hypothetical protein KR222_008143 [Zaprionus bogoriensis]